MQPLQYNLGCPAAKENSITHAAAMPSNLDAASTMRFAASRRKPARIYARGNIRSTIMQPFQCDLQPQIQETHRTTHTGTNTRCKTHRRNHNDRSRNRRTDEVPFIAGCSHFTRKNTRFRAPASSPKHNPCNIHAAIPM